MTSFRFSLPSAPPTDSAAQAAAQALPRVGDLLSRHRVEDILQFVVPAVDGDDQETIPIPRSAVDVLRQALVHLAAGRSVSVVDANAELTTQQAADLLEVSRPHLIKLLERGDMAFRRVGTHRRVTAASLVAYEHSVGRGRGRRSAVRNGDAYSPLDGQVATTPIPTPAVASPTTP